MTESTRPVLLVLASTYPRWRNDPEPGFVHELCRRLVVHFHVIALVPDAPEADPGGILDGVEVVRYRYAPRRLQTLVNHGGIVANLRQSSWKWLLVPSFVLCQYFSARRLMRTYKVDLIHAHWLLPQGLIARRLSRRTSVPYVVTSHGGDLFGLRGWLLNKLKRRVAASCSAMTVVSDAMREEAKRIGLAPPHLQVLSMGVDLQAGFVPDALQHRARDELLFVGRLVPKKGLVHLLNAMPAVLAERPAVNLMIVGFGPEESALKQQAERLEIAGSIRFMGAMPQAELPALYRRAALFVAPFIRDQNGDQEGLPVALMEAIGCGCPVVVGNVAGVHELLGDAASEMAVNPADIDTLAATILAALRNPVQSARRVTAIRAAAMARVDWRHIAEGYRALLKGCIKRTG